MTTQEGVVAEVWNRGGRVYSLGDGGEVLEDDPDERRTIAVRQMRAVFAQPERGATRVSTSRVGLIHQRMAKGKKEKTATGGYIRGAPPFRYPSVHRVTLLPEPEMQHTLTRMMAMNAEGRSLRDIIRALHAEGLTPRGGGRGHPASIARILARA
jgi:DNA invertase Pin-like site-specific DNA recombinase